MIDIENELLTILSDELKKTYPEINIAGEFIRRPSGFPHVTVEEENNTTYRETLTNKENHVRITIKINVYSNKVEGKKQEAKSIFKIIDKKMLELGFTRQLKRPAPNIEDSTIYRMFGRYVGVVDNRKVIYRG